MPSPKLPLPVALLWIMGSVFVVTGSVYSLWTWNLYQKVAKEKAPVLCHIMQTRPHTDALKADYLAEILGLSRDHPTPLKEFDIRKAMHQLQEMPMIKEAKVMTLAEDTVYIDYTMREPIAMVYDYENIAVDEEGFLFPFSPFYSPKDLPELYFGFIEQKSSEHSFIKPLEGPEWKLATHLVKILSEKAQEEKVRLQRVDISHAFAKSLGRQEIVISFGVGDANVHYLRLHPREYEQQLGNYFALYSQLPLEEKVIDLRIGGLAFIK